MAYTITDGRPGLDGIFTVNSLALNDLSTFPRVKFDTESGLTGYYDAPDTDDTRAKKTGRIGETVGPASEGGKTLVFPGTVQAKTLPGLRAYVAEIQAALAPRSDEQFFTIDPPAAVGGTQWGFNARIMPPSPGIPEAQKFGSTALPSPWQRDFSLTVRMSDPRFYVLDTVIDETTSTPGTGVTVTNLGTAPSDPVITLEGVTAGTVCEVSSGGKTLQFAAPANSGNLVINFLKRTATVGTHDQGGVIEIFNSTWWDANTPGLEPGVAETITATGCTGLTVQAFHASW